MTELSKFNMWMIDAGSKYINTQKRNQTKPNLT